MITFHNNLTKAKIAKVSSVTQYPASQLLNLVVSFRDFSCAVSGFGQSPEMKYFCHRCWSQYQGILMDIVHGCSGVTYLYLMKQDFFSLRILHENSLRLPFHF